MSSLHCVDSTESGGVSSPRNFLHTSERNPSIRDTSKEFIAFHIEAHSGATIRGTDYINIGIFDSARFENGVVELCIDL